MKMELSRNMERTSVYFLNTAKVWEIMMKPKYTTKEAQVYSTDLIYTHRRFKQILCQDVTKMLTGNMIWVTFIRTSLEGYYRSI